MRYGVPYQGSKNQIAKWVIDNLPKDKILVDLFAGGCAVTHAAMLSGKWDRIVANDIGDAPELFCDAIDGKYADEKRWISREDFQDLKDIDPYVSLCWSFGNNRSNYLYGKEIEPWKKALHYARVFGDCSLLREMGIDSDGSSKDILKYQKQYKEKYIRWWLSKQKYISLASNKLITNDKLNIKENKDKGGQYFISSLKKSELKSIEKLQSAQRLEVVQNLSRVKMLQSLQSLQTYKNNLTVYRKNYWDVTIPDDAIVYADPPYKGTYQDAYKCDFNYATFEKWLNEVPFMVIVSEYNAPAGCVEIASIKKQSTFAQGNKGGTNTEKLFVQERFYNEYLQKMGRWVVLTIK